jgi:hypothetical protein
MNFSLAELFPCGTVKSVSGRVLDLHQSVAALMQNPPSDPVHLLVNLQKIIYDALEK